MHNTWYSITTEEAETIERTVTYLLRHLSRTPSRGSSATARQAVHNGAEYVARFLLYLTRAIVVEPGCAAYSLHLPAHATLAQFLSFLQCHFGLEAAHSVLHDAVMGCQQDRPLLGLDATTAGPVAAAIELLSAWPLRRIAFSLQARVGLWGRNGYKATMHGLVYMTLGRSRNVEKDLYMVQLRAMSSSEKPPETLAAIVAGVFHLKLQRQWLLDILLGQDVSVLFEGDNNNLNRMECASLLRDLLLLLLAVVDDDALFGATPHVRRRRFALCLLALHGKLQHKKLAERLYAEDYTIREQDMQAVLEEVAEFVPHDTRRGLMHEGAYRLRQDMWPQVAIWFATLKLDKESSMAELALNIRRKGHRAGLGAGSSSDSASRGAPSGAAAAEGPIDRTPPITPLSGTREALRPFLTSAGMLALAVRVMQVMGEARGTTWHNPLNEGLALRLLMSAVEHVSEEGLYSLLTTTMSDALHSLVEGLTPAPMPTPSETDSQKKKPSSSLGEAIIGLAQLGPISVYAPLLQRMLGSQFCTEASEAAQVVQVLLDSVQAQSGVKADATKRAGTPLSKAERVKAKVHAKQAKLMAAYDKRKTKFLTGSHETAMRSDVATGADCETAKGGRSAMVGAVVGSSELTSSNAYDAAAAAAAATGDEGKETDNPCPICQQAMAPNLDRSVVLLCSDTRIPIPMYQSLKTLGANAFIAEPYGPETPGSQPSTCRALGWTSCGHMLHRSCLTGFLKQRSLVTEHGRRLRIELNETTCPLCRRMGAPGLAWLPPPAEGGMMDTLRPLLQVDVSHKELQEMLSLKHYWTCCQRDTDDPLDVSRLLATRLGRITEEFESQRSSLSTWYSSICPPGLKCVAGAEERRWPRMRKISLWRRSSPHFTLLP